MESRGVAEGRYNEGERANVESGRAASSSRGDEWKKLMRMGGGQRGMNGGERGDDHCWATVVRVLEERRKVEEAGALVGGAEEEDEKRRCSPWDEGWSQTQSAEREPAGVKEEKSRVEEAEIYVWRGLQQGEQREAARPIIDWALLGEHGSEFSRHFQHISLLFQAARCSATQSPWPSKEK